MASASRKISIEFVVDGEAAYKNSLNSINQTLGKVKVGMLAVSAAVLAVYEGYKKLIDLTTDVASNADEILTLSQITGIDTNSIQELQYASELIDVSFETIKGSVTKLTNNMQTAQKGTGAAAQAFEALGVTVANEDGSLKDANSTFYEVIDALGGIENETERNAYAMDIFGKSAEELNPLILQGTEALQGYREEAEKTGAVLSGEQLEALGAVDDAYQRLQQTQETIRKQISAEMAPAVENFYKAWTDFMQKAGQALIDSGIIDNLSGFLTDLVKIIENLTKANDETIPDTVSSLSSLQQVLNGVARLFAAIKDTLNVIGDILRADFFDLLADLGLRADEGYLNNYQATKLKQEGATWVKADGTSGITSWRNASGDMNFNGGYTWVGESGAELVRLPQGSQILSNQESRNMSGDTYNITIDAKSVREFNDIVAIVKNSRVTSRMRG